LVHRTHSLRSSPLVNIVSSQACKSAQLISTTHLQVFLKSIEGDSKSEFLNKEFAESVNAAQHTHVDLSCLPLISQVGWGFPNIPLKTL